MAIDPYFKALLDDAAIAAKRVKMVLDAVQGSPITLEAERLVPRLAALAPKLAMVAGIAGNIVPAIAAIETVIAIYDGLGGHGQDMGTPEGMALQADKDAAQGTG